MDVKIIDRFLDPYTFNELQKFYNKFGITEVETNPELIENTAIQQLWKNYENNQHKNRATFTKEI